MSEPTQEEIDVAMDKAYEAEENGSAYPGMSYEDGVKAVIEWFAGSEEPPFDNM